MNGAHTPRSADWGESRTNPIHRWWGCEISFDPRLDEHFNIANVKEKLLPTKDLSAAINDKIKGVIKSYVKEVQRVWKEFDAKKQIEVDDKKKKTKPDIVTQKRLLMLIFQLKKMEWLL